MWKITILRQKILFFPILGGGGGGGAPVAPPWLRHCFHFLKQFGTNKRSIILTLIKKIVLLYDLWIFNTSSLSQREPHISLFLITKLYIVITTTVTLYRVHLSTSGKQITSISSTLYFRETRTATTTSVILHQLRNIYSISYCSVAVKCENRTALRIWFLVF